MTREGPEPQTHRAARSSAIMRRMLAKFSRNGRHRHLKRHMAAMANHFRSDLGHPFRGPLGVICTRPALLTVSPLTLEKRRRHQSSHAGFFAIIAPSPPLHSGDTSARLRTRSPRKRGAGPWRCRERASLAPCLSRRRHCPSTLGKSDCGTSPMRWRRGGAETEGAGDYSLLAPPPSRDSS